MKKPPDKFNATEAKHGQEALAIWLQSVQVYLQFEYHICTCEGLPLDSCHSLGKVRNGFQFLVPCPTPVGISVVYTPPLVLFAPIALNMEIFILAFIVLMFIADLFISGLVSKHFTSD